MIGDITGLNQKMVWNELRVFYFILSLVALAQLLNSCLQANTVHPSTTCGKGGM